MQYVMGIDGGGTKTVAVIATTEGEILTQKIVGPTNPNGLTQKQLEETIRNLFTKLSEETPGRLDRVRYVFGGMSGVAAKEEQEKLINIMKGMLASHTSIHVVPDPVNALYSGTYGKWGMVQIAGTGSITYGMNRFSEHGRIGGWGYLLGDEGSGFDIGRQAIKAVLAQEDGLIEETVLKERLLQFYNVKTVRELVRTIYEADSSKEKIAAVSKEVFQAYKQKDPASIDILEYTVKQLISQIMNLKKRLFPKEANVPVVLTGGVLSKSEILPKMIKEALQNDDSIQICLPEIPPVGGSVIGALMDSGVKINDKIIQRIKNSYKLNKRGERNVTS